METKLDQPVPFNVGAAIKMIIGGFLVLAGILLTLDNLEIFDTYRLLAWWPLVLVLIGLLKILAKSGRFFGAVLIVFGAWMLALNLHLTRITFFDLWPLIFVLAGGAMVARAFGWNPIPKNLASRAEGPNLMSILATRNVVEKSPDYRGGSVFSFMGASQVDLSAAAMVQRPAIIDATAIMGAVEILVPDDWEVAGEVVPVMGGFEMKCASGGGAAGEILIRGVAFMGGIEVKSVRRTS